MKKLNLAFLFLMLSLATIQLFPQAGSLDTSFDGDGWRLYDFGDTHDNAYGLVTFPDTTTVLLGSAHLNGTTAGVLFRILPDSDVDMSFATDGFTEIQAGNATYAYNLLLLEDGKFLVSGVVALSGSDEQMFAARLDSDGFIDEAFGDDGFFISDYGTESNSCNAMAVQDNGKIILAGRTNQGNFSQLLFCRLNSDGTLDTDFGTNGYTEINASVQDERINSVGVLSSGSIVGVGYGYASNPWFGNFACIAKLNPDGTPMTSFGGDGVITPTIFTDISNASYLAIRNDSLFVTGDQYDSNNLPLLFITKMDSSGVAAASFGNNGIKLTGLNSVNYGLNIMLTSDGKIYNCGTTGIGGPGDREFLLIRYMANGSYDNTFGDNGKVTTDIRSDWDEAYAMGMQPDGKILLAGMSGGLTNSGDNKLPIARYLNDFVPFSAQFSTDNQVVCQGSSVDFIDQSGGEIVNWAWTFEGGTPSSSTQQNPTITYDSEGLFDVELIVTNENGDKDTLLKIDYIQVITIPDQPDQPSGLTAICNNESYEYSTSPVEYANMYFWEVIPAEAGTFSGNGTIVDFQASETWTGDFTIKVRASNSCGNGEWSENLNGTMYQSPTAYTLEGGGEYCNGDDGIEITLSDSQTGVDYQLFFNGEALGDPIAGTGSEISFGFQTGEGSYNATGYNDHCTVDMVNQADISVSYPPVEPATPTGPQFICAGVTTEYVSEGSPDADTYEWLLGPASAGTLTADGLTATVVWNPDFSGEATIELYGINDCGNGNPTVPLEIDVDAVPSPEITGSAMVCDDEEEAYQATENDGSSYTWEAMGGTIVSGQGTYMITVLWGTPGEGSVSVMETSQNECMGASEEFLVTIDDCTAIKENNLRNSISLSPNPASDFVTINSESTIESVRIYTLKGQPIEMIISGDTKTRLNTAGLQKGIYILKVQTSKGQVIKRLVIE